VDLPWFVSSNTPDLKRSATMLETVARLAETDWASSLREMILSERKTSTTSVRLISRAVRGRVAIYGIFYNL
jgi:hypothetical protein